MGQIKQRKLDQLGISTKTCKSGSAFTNKELNSKWKEQSLKWKIIPRKIKLGIKKLIDLIIIRIFLILSKNRRVKRKVIGS